MKIKRAVFIYPYYREVPIYGFFPPLGLEYVAAAVEDLVEDLCILDLRWEEDLESSFRDLVGRGVDLFCVSVNWHYEYESVLDIIRALPADVPTVVGGTHATQNVEDLFASCPNIDVIVRGDGEETLREYVATGSPEGVDGLSFRRNGKIVHNPNRDLRPVSDTLIPLRHKRRYRYRATYQKVDLGYSFDSMVASRGCPFNCKFCSFKRNSTTISSSIPSGRSGSATSSSGRNSTRSSSSTRGSTSPSGPGSSRKCARRDSACS
ncbi:MAG: B12-binding domain-containing radical SAM protein [Planctomycetota bacterium]